jgi:hypothetical protein
MYFVNKIKVHLHIKSNELKQQPMDEDRYYELKAREKAFTGAERKCDECGLMFYARVHNQHKCDNPECIEQRRIEREAAINHELRQSVRKTSMRNPLYPSPSDFLYITEF